MSAINFVVRDVAGNISRGSVAGEGVPSSLIVGAGADVSLNLNRGQVISYTRQGQALEITLIDGRVIVIEGYFTTEGVSENQLFLSADGYLTEVNLTQGAGADYYANYVQDAGGAGKFALNDDLTFMRGADVMLADSYVPVDDEVGMLGAAIGGLAPIFGWGGAAAAGAAVLATGGGGGGGGPAAPEVDVTSGTGGNEHIVNEDDHADGVEIGGNGTPFATVEVTIEGVTETTTVAEDGTWEVTFDSDEVRTGEYTTDVEVVITNEGGSTTVMDTLIVDTIIGADMNATGGADAVINASEYGDGVTLTGTVEGSDSVIITIDGQEYTADVTYDEVTNTGTWTLDVSTFVMGEGEYTKDITISTSDAAGNSSSTTATVEVDTLIGVTGSSVGGADGVINASEFNGGVTLNGTVTGNDAVVVSIDGQSYDAVVSYDEVSNTGMWTLLVPTSVMGEGEYTKNVTVTTTDQAGNSDSASMTVEVDTLIGVDTGATGGADGVINASEFNGGVTLNGTVTGNDSVVVTIDGQTYNATVSYNEVTNQGTWTLDVPTSVMGEGEYTKNVTVTTTDQAGNSDSASMTVEVDTLIGVDTGATGGADGVINASEFNGGVTLNGTVTGNDSVVVTIDGQTYNATVNYNEVTNQGTWTLAVPTSVMGAGEYTKNVTVTTTDQVGNSDTASMTVEVDTLIGVDTNATGGADSVINAAEFGSGVMLSGSVTGNDSVVVTIDGQQFNAVVSYNEVTNQGTWTLAVPTSVMGAGEYTKNVSVTTTDAAGNSASANMIVEVDTLIGVEGNATGGADNVINGAEYGNGVMLSGSVTGNNAVVVNIDGQTYNAVVSYNEVSNTGTWTLAVPTSVMGEGEYTRNVTVTTTDAAGNSDSTPMTVEVDTYVNELSTTPFVSGDDLVNGAEADAGLTLTGSVEGNSTVMITYNYPGGQIVREASVVNGTWTVSYAPGEVPEGDYTANITIAATDEHGNIDSITDTFRVDTVAPDAPGIDNVTTNSVGVEYIGIDPTDNDVTVTEITSSHQSNQLATQDDGENAFGNTWFEFDPELSNGSHLVVNETDSSGNSNATFVVLEETSTDAVDLAGLSGFDIGSIDLNFAQDANLTLDLATLQGLSDQNNNLIIHGGVNGDNDTVTILGANETGQSKDIDGKSYDIYTMGDDAEIFIEEGVNVIN